MSLIILTLIVPVQAGLMHYFSIVGVKPDLGLIVVCLVGFKMGEREGLIMGVSIGMVLDLFSGGAIGSHLLTKPIMGFISGVIGRTMLDIRMVVFLGTLIGLSLFSGCLVYLFMQVSIGGMSFSQAFRFIILPQAVYDGIVGAILLTFFIKRPVPGQI